MPIALRIRKTSSMICVALGLKIQIKKTNKATPPLILNINPRTNLNALGCDFIIYDE
jgi:hypothetical protein